jgi:Ca2+-binding RTX toxin-like protein
VATIESAAVGAPTSLDTVERGDRLFGARDGDTVAGGNGDDRMGGGYGADSLNGGEGNDVLHARALDGTVDALDCGGGDRDKAFVRGEDTTVNCVKVTIVYGGSDAVA